MTYQGDPLENLPAGGSADRDQLPPPGETTTIDVPLVSKRSREDLEGFGINFVEDYRDFKHDLLTWLGTYGKTPEKAEGLASSTLQSTHYKLETTFRWLWDYEGAYSTDFTPEHADRFIRVLDRSNGMIDSTVLHHAKAIKRLFKYINHANGTDYDWDPEPELSQANGQERDYLPREAFKPLYEASIEYHSVRAYNNSDMTPEEREQIKTYLSQRMSIPKKEVGPEEFRAANSWKIPSMIATTLDTGLRPIEVGRAKVQWVNLEACQLNIPKEESTKNEAHWNCSLKQRTARVLDRWLDERATYELYADRDNLWLTKQGTPYRSKSCNYMLRRLIETGDIPIPDHKEINWYSIRHGVATYWANHLGPHHAKEQLRHKSLTTTLKYLHSDPETREKAVEQIW